MTAAEYQATAKRGNKYGAKPVEIDGIRFASRAEGRRYSELTLMLRAGEITDLELQPVYKLEVNGVKIGRYTGDFRYVDAEGNTVCEDVKGSPSRDYILRKKLVKALHGVDVKEIRR